MNIQRQFSKFREITVQHSSLLYNHYCSTYTTVIVQYIEPILFNIKNQYFSMYRTIIVQYTPPFLSKCIEITVQYKKSSFNIKRHYSSKSPDRNLEIHPLTFIPMLQTASKQHNPILNAKYVKQPSDYHPITRTVTQHIAPTNLNPQLNDRQTDPRWGRTISSYQGLGSKGGYEPGILTPLDKHINKAV